MNALTDTPRPEQEIFSDLAELTASPGYLHALAFFAWRDNFLTFSVSGMTPEDMAKSYSPSRLLRTEISTLLGLMVKSQKAFDLPNPETIQTYLDRTEALLEEFHNTLIMPMMEAFRRGEVDKDRSPFHGAKALREPIFYGGESAYSFQYRDLAVERYSKDDVWLTEEMGFSVEHARSAMAAIVELQNDQLTKLTKGFANSDPASWTLLPGFTFRVPDIVERTGLDENVVKSVISTFAISSFPANEDFNNASDFNLVNAKPILAMDSEHYVSLQSYSLYEALYESPFYWMIKDRGYRESATKHRGFFTEEFVAKRLKKVFGSGQVYSNVYLVGPKKQRLGEIDVLVMFADRALVIQCKSKKLTIESRKGNDLQLQSDFKRAVQDSYDQGYNCAKTLLKQKCSVEDADGQPISVPKLTEIYILNVVSDHYPALTVQAREFLKYETDEVINPPLVCDVFLMDAMTEFLASPLRLLSYINRRANYSEKVSSINELTILGYHLASNLWVDDEMDFIMISDDCAIDLDTAMTVRRENIPGERTPRGILTAMQNSTVEKLIRQIEFQAEPSLVDLGFLLLGLSGKALRDFSNGIDTITSQTRQDRGAHDFTMCFDGNDGGICVHCGNDSNSVAADRLARHCELRKYSNKSDVWHGLVVRQDDGMPKFGLQLKSDWTQDDDLDRATRGMAAASTAEVVGGQLKRIKVGRNDLCPCGSGKKFKKCCLQSGM